MYLRSYHAKKIKQKSNLLIAIILLLLYTTFNNCLAQAPKTTNTNNIEVAANNLESYLPLLQSKQIGIVANQTSVIFKSKNQQEYTHLIDSLTALKVSIKTIFSPEHGFRGKADAGEIVANRIDKKTGVPIVSLYGKNKKPSKSQLEGLDILLFDIQDVGVRFYTYISTLHYVMEACAEARIPVIVLDRPNPNAHYIDGPILEPEHKSFIGMHPVPVVYGMTIGEYAQMIQGEGWLKNKTTCELTVIPLKNYSHQSNYSLPIRPSPNLPNDRSINLYPSLGFFEGTSINSGRGTEHQFQQYGAPWFPRSTFTYTPKANFGAKHPKHKNKLCHGVNLRSTKPLSKINISWLKDAYVKTKDSTLFFEKTFTLHVGNTQLKKQLEAGLSVKEIEDSWKGKIEIFKKIRKKYLHYK